MVGLSGLHAQLADRVGNAKAVDLGLLQRTGSFLGGADRRPPLTHAVLAGVAGPAADEARRWEPHILEVLTGQPVGGDGDAVARRAFDPRTTTLTQREKNKADELAEAGWENASVRTVKRMRQRFEARGVAGLVDGRTVRRPDIGQRVDPRVLAGVGASARRRGLVAVGVRHASSSARFSAIQRSTSMIASVWVLRKGPARASSTISYSN